MISSSSRACCSSVKSVSWFSVWMKLKREKVSSSFFMNTATMSSVFSSPDTDLRSAKFCWYLRDNTN